MCTLFNVKYGVISLVVCIFPSPSAPENTDVKEIKELSEYFDTIISVSSRLEFKQGGRL